MPNAILIGFEYRWKKSIRTLPAIIIDLYRMYQYCQSVGINDIFVITDIEDDVKITEHLRAMVEDVIDSQMNTFISTIHERGHLNVFTHSDTIYKFQAIFDRIKNWTQVLIYYTGHGVDNAIILPSLDKLPIQLLRDSIVERCDLHAQICWIMDCCSPSHLYLPYQLTMQTRYKIKDLTYIPTQNIICFGGADQKSAQSIMTRNGSVFSNKLLELFKNNRTYIPYIHKILQSDKIANYKFHIGIYSSHPDIYWMWSWLVPSKIKIDLSHKIIYFI